MTRKGVIRCLILYSPAIVCAVWAIVISIYGRSDATVITWLLALALALVLHTRQSLSDRRKDRERLSR